MADERLGQLVAEIVLDQTKMRSEMRELQSEISSFAAQTNKHLSTMTRASTTLGGAFANAARYAGVFGVALSGRALVNYARTTFAAVDAIDSMSDRLGVSVEALSELDYAARLSDTDLSAVTTAMQYLARQLTAASNGSREAAGLFADLGLNAQELKKLRLDQVFEQVGKAIVKTGTQAENLGESYKLLGRSAGPAVLGLMENISELRAEAYRFNAVIGNDTATAVDNAQDSITQLSIVAQGHMRDLVGAFSPLISALVEVSTEASLTRTNWKPFVETLAVGAGIIADALQEVIHILSNIRAGLNFATVQWLEFLQKIDGWLLGVKKGIEDAFDMEPATEALKEAEEKLTRERGRRGPEDKNAIRYHEAQVKLAKERVDAEKAAADAAERHAAAIKGLMTAQFPNIKQIGPESEQIAAARTLDELNKRNLEGYRETILTFDEMEDSARSLRNEADELSRGMAEIYEVIAAGGAPIKVGPMIGSTIEIERQKREAQRQLEDDLALGRSFNSNSMPSTRIQDRLKKWQLDAATDAGPKEQGEASNEVATAKIESEALNRRLQEERNALEIRKLRESALGEEQEAVIRSLQERMNAEIAASEAVANADDDATKLRTSAALAYAKFRTEVARTEARERIDADWSVWSAIGERQRAVQNNALELSELRKQAATAEADSLIATYERALNVQLDALTTQAAAEGEANQRRAGEAAELAAFEAELAKKKLKERLETDAMLYSSTVNRNDAIQQLQTEMGMREIEARSAIEQQWNGVYEGLMRERIDLEFQLQNEKNELARQGLQERIALIDEELAAAQKAADAEIGIRQTVTNAALGLLQSFASEHRGAAIALLVVQKAMAIKEIMMNAAKAKSMIVAYYEVAIAQALAMGPLGLPWVATLEAKRAAALAKVATGTGIAVGLVAAQGLAEVSQLSRGGTVATRGTTANPIITSNAASSSAAQAIREDPRERVVKIYIQGGVVTSAAVRDLVDQIRDELESTDVLLFGPNSTQARVRPT